MNKKVNTILFIVCATLFNVFVIVLVSCILIFLYVRFLMPLIPNANSAWGFMLIFLAAVAVSFLVYRFLLKYLLKKIDMEKYFDPIFVKKYRKK